MGLAMLVLVVMVVIAAVLALDLFGIGWAVRRVWRYVRAHRRGGPPPA